MHPNFWVLRLVTVKSELLMNLIQWNLACIAFRAESYLFWQKLILRPYEPVCWILGLLISIRVRGTVLLDWGSGFRILFFLEWLSRCKREIGFYSTFVLLFLNVGKFTSFFSDNMLFRSHKAVEIKFFHNFCLLMEESGSVHIITDPDSEHLWTEYVMFFIWKANSGSILIRMFCFATCIR